MRRRFPIPVLLVVAVLASSGAACSGDDPGEAEGPDAANAELDQRDAALAFAECMRDQGVEDYPDPVFGESGEPTFSTPDEGDPDLPAATEACEGLLDGSPGFDAVDPDTVAANQQRLLDFAQCMRDHGIDVPDPVFGDQPQEDDGGDEPAQEVTDEFLEAEQACRSELPSEEPQP